MLNLVRKGIDFKNSVLSTTGKPFSKADWESLDSDIGDKSFAKIMHQKGENFGAVLHIESNKNEFISDKDVYKIVRGTIIEMLSIDASRGNKKSTSLSKSFDPKLLLNGNSPNIIGTITLSEFVNIPKVPITIEVEYKPQPSAKKELKKIIISDKCVDILYNLIIKSKGISVNKYKYILYYNDILLTDSILSDIIDTELLLANAPPQKGKKIYPRVELKIIEDVNNKNFEELKCSQKTLDSKIENAISSLFADVINFKTKIPNIKFIESKDVDIKNEILLISYMIYWGLHILINNVQNQYQIIDCIISLKRCIILLNSNYSAESNFNILLDIEIILEKLIILYNVRNYKDIMSSIANDYPMLINSSTFSLSTKSHGIELFPSQESVLSISYRHLQEESNQSPQTPNSAFNKYNISPALIGYKVPPSGGKTMLSISLGGMISKNFHNKTLIYICYNKLVRLSVANACKMADMPFWVVSNCADITISYTGRKNGNSKHKPIPKIDGALGEKYEFYRSDACKELFYRPKMIISDTASAVELLAYNAPAFFVYLDEPTAGAENGIGILKEGIQDAEHSSQLKTKDLLVENDIQKLNAQIISLCVNTQLILASSTLPSFEQLPILSSLFPNRYYIDNNTMPVGCMAIHPDGYEILPHELAEDLIEFREILLNISEGHSTNIKFYTFDKVRQIALAIDHMEDLPELFKFNNYFNDICLLSPQLVHRYIIELFTYLYPLPDELLIHYQELIYTVNTTKIHHLKDILKDGKMLIVSLRNSFESEISETVADSSVMIGLTPCMNKFYEECNICIPEFDPIMKEFENAKINYAKQVERYKKASKAEKEQMEEPRSPPEFIWPYKVGSSSTVLSDIELQILPPEVSATMLSGVGFYDPVLLTDGENSTAIREATHGRLAVLGSTPDIAYGTNMAIITIFIDGCYGLQTTQNSLFQVIGRAGRLGKSYKARVVFNDISVMKKALVSSNRNNLIEPGVMEFYLRAALGI